MNDIPLVGRAHEQTMLGQLFAVTQCTRGGIVLLAGEAGVGKTRLLEACLTRSSLLALTGSARAGATPPYGPIVAALRAYLRVRADGLSSCGPLAPHLAVLLPELGAPPPTDSTTLIEALCQAFTAIAHNAPTVLVLDDLQWADNATLELVPLLASALAQEQLLIVGTYRSDEIGRGHPLRRLRNDLRRARLLQEIVVAPLDHEATVALAAHILGAPLPAEMGAALYERTEGVPLFIEELASVLAERDHKGVLASGVELPIPETLRDAVLLRLDGLSEPMLRLLHLAAVAGDTFDMALVMDLAGTTDGLERLIERGLIVEQAAGQGAFRHALTREAIYVDLAWGQRRAIHAQLAERLTADHAAPLAIAQHWLAAHHPDRARAALCAAATHASAIHAYRDAMVAAQQALDLWPDSVDDVQRLDLLDQLGTGAQLCGMLAEAARAWREVSQGHRASGDLRACAEAERKLATVAALQGQWEHALAAHEMAAQAFAASMLPVEAVIERLSAIAHLRSAGRYRAALDVLAITQAEAIAAHRPDLHARSLALEGNISARMGRVAEGLALVQHGLSLALTHNLAHTAAEIYQRLADTMEHGGDYAGAKATYVAASDFCQTHALPVTAQLCIACLTAVLRQTGEWDRAMTLCREVLDAPESMPHGRAVACGMLGSLYVLRGQPRHAQPLLHESAALAQQIELAAMELLAAWGLALLDTSNGADAAAVERGRVMLNRWAEVEDVHYVIPALRWAASLFARTHNRADACACANALAQIASTTSQPEALSALAHALGEVALLDGDRILQCSSSLKHSIYYTISLFPIVTPARNGAQGLRASPRISAMLPSRISLTRIAPRVSWGRVRLLPLLPRR